MEPVCDKQNNPLTSWLASIWVTVSLLLRCQMFTRQNERAWKKQSISSFVLNGVCTSGVITSVLNCNSASPGHAKQNVDTYMWIFFFLIDVNECEVYRLDKGVKLCVHECVNVPGSYHCSCPSGYKLLHDRRSCEGEWLEAAGHKGSFKGSNLEIFPGM